MSPDHTRFVIVLVSALLLCTPLSGCSDTPTGDDQGNPFDIPDIGEGVRPSDTDLDTEQDTPPADDDPDEMQPPEDAPIRVDAFREDGFVRPGTDTMDEPDPEPDPEPEPDPMTVVTGTHECLRYTIQASSTTFTLKEDVISVFYEVRNTCNISLRMRTEHESDFFTVAILKDGLPWIFLAEPYSCENTGPVTEFVLNPGDGWVRGWLWRPDDHESRLMRCGATYDRDATYSIVGYGMEPVPRGSPNGFSDVFVMTDPIEILLVQ